MNLNFLNKIGGAAVDMAAKQGLKIRAKSPKILLVAGSIGVGVGFYMAIKAGTKHERIMEFYDIQLNHARLVKEAADKGNTTVEYTEEDYNRDLFVIYSKRTMEFVKNYGPALLTTAVGVACFVGSNRIMDTRVAGMAAAYEALQKGFDYYRNRVIDEYGEDADFRMKHGVTMQETKEEILDEETGKKKKRTVARQYFDPNGVSQYAKFFDEYSPRWSKSAEYNYFFLVTAQNQANDELKRKGTMFLNEVYDMIGVPRTKAGCVVGWVYDNQGDAFIDFDILSPRNADFVNGYERSILLDFNVQGPIWNQLQ